MEKLFVDNFQNLTFFAVFLFSMLPIFEAKAALPFGMSYEIWGQQALSPGLSFLASFIGSTLIGILLFLSLVPICKAMNRTVTFKKLAVKIENFFKKTNFSNFKLIGLLSIPIPLTGVWTGAGIAAFSGMKIINGIVAIIIGNLISTLIIFTLCLFFNNSGLAIFITILVMSLVFIVFSRIKKLILSRNQTIIK